MSGRSRARPWWKAGCLFCHLVGGHNDACLYRKVMRAAARAENGLLVVPSLVEWYEELMEDPEERRRSERVATLAAVSHGDARIERELRELIARAVR